MVEEDKGSPDGTGYGDECLLASRDADGTIRSIGPFARERAEALVQVYGNMYPNQTCWVEPLPEPVQTLHTRVQRHRRDH